MNTEKWHDLTKNPEDLPTEMDVYWIVTKDNPNEVDTDSFDPDAVGRNYSSPIIKDKKIVGNEEYLSSGWWDNSKPGMITHWMVMPKPQKPELPKA